MYLTVVIHEVVVRSFDDSFRIIRITVSGAVIIVSTILLDTTTVVCSLLLLLVGVESATYP